MRDFFRLNLGCWTRARSFTIGRVTVQIAAPCCLVLWWAAHPEGPQHG